MEDARETKAEVERKEAGDDVEKGGDEREHGECFTCFECFTMLAREKRGFKGDDRTSQKSG